MMRAKATVQIYVSRGTTAVRSWIIKVSRTREPVSSTSWCTSFPRLDAGCHVGHAGNSEHPHPQVIGGDDFGHWDMPDQGPRDSAQETESRLGFRSWGEHGRVDSFLQVEPEFRAGFLAIRGNSRKGLGHVGEAGRAYYHWVRPRDSRPSD